MPSVSCQSWTFSWAVNSILGRWITFNFCGWLKIDLIKQLHLWIELFVFSQSSQKGFEEKRKERGLKTKLHVQIPILVLHHLLAELSRALFEVVCNYCATDITKRMITLWLFLSTDTQLVAYTGFAGEIDNTVHTFTSGMEGVKGARGGCKNGGKEEEKEGG